MYGSRVQCYGDCECEECGSVAALKAFTAETIVVNVTKNFGPSQGVIAKLSDGTSFEFSERRAILYSLDHNAS